MVRRLPKQEELSIKIILKTLLDKGLITESEYTKALKVIRDLHQY